MKRRTALKTLAAMTGGSLLAPIKAEAASGQFQIATFSTDVTPPLGHPLIAGWREPAKTIKDRLSARGLALLGGGKPLVIVSIDWCELRNDAYDRWRDVLAKAAGTTRERVLVTTVHQHDAPYADLTAQKLLDAQGLPGSMFDPEFHEACVQRTAAALRESLKSKRRVTHYGIGAAKVEKVACNRRVQLKGSPPRFNRYSSTRDPQVRYAPDGEIDPLLKTLSFWEGERALVAISSYATHPMSYYGRGDVSYDFVGMAREMRQRADAGVFQVYVSGCAGDVTAAKYNDADYEGRVALARRLHDGMVAAWQGTRRYPLEKIGFRAVPIRFEPEASGKLAVAALKATLANEKASHQARSQAALGLSWHERCAAGQPVDLPAIDFGAAQFALLPAEAFVGYQLAAQKMRPDSFVMTAGYGECAPGYIPTAQTRAEGFVEEHGYCWVAPGAEKELLRALGEALK